MCNPIAAPGSTGLEGFETFETFEGFERFERFETLNGWKQLIENNGTARNLVEKPWCFARPRRTTGGSTVLGSI